MFAHAWILSSLLVTQTPAPGGAPSSPPAVQSPDPAAATFSTGAGLLLVAVRADRTADYEAAIQALQAGFAAVTDPSRRAVAQGWRVFKAAETDAAGNVLYVHVLFPVVSGTDYRPSVWLDLLIADLPADLMRRYKEALAGSPTRLSLTELAHMSVTPVRK